MVAQINKTQEERLAKAIASIQERDGYCLVASETEDMPHVVTINENYYATYCTCVGHSQYGADCYHMNAVDRYFDDRRPNFYEMHGIQRPAKQQVEKPAVEASPAETHRASCVHGAAGAVWYPEYRQGNEWYRYPEPGTTHSVHFLDESPERAEQWLANRLASQVSHEREGQLPQETRQKLYNWKQSESGDQMEREYIAAQETADSNMRHFYDEY